WMVTALGCFGGDFNIDNGLLLSFSHNCLTSCLTNSQVCVCNRAKRGPKVPVRAGATPRTFWAAESRKSGVAPARSGVFFCVTFLILVSFISSFSRDLYASQAEEDGEDEAEVGNSYLLHLLRPKFSPRTRAPKEVSCCAVLSLGHLLDGQGDREGEGYGDLCLSCTRHPPVLQIATEAL